MREAGDGPGGEAGDWERAGDGIVELNVGGERFTTSKATLTSVPDSFFSALLSGRIPALKDGSGAVFVDREPALFRPILNYLRTKRLELGSVSVSALRHEAEFYGLGPLVKRLSLCEELEETPCGDVLFHGFLPPPPLPSLEGGQGPSPATPASPASPSTPAHSRGHSRNLSEPPLVPLRRLRSHRRGASSDLTRLLSEELHGLLKQRQLRSLAEERLRVRLIAGHHNWVAVGYAHFVACYRLKDSLGWQLAYSSPPSEANIRHVAINAKFGAQSSEKMLAAATDDAKIHLWALGSGGVGGGGEEAPEANKVGVFTLGVGVDSLFWIGSQLVGLSRTGKTGIWHGMNWSWQVQDVVPISAFDRAGSALLLGCTNGSIYYIDMQKFPLRMKDGDLLVTELYRDPSAEAVTSLSVYLTPKTNLCGNWLEIAYGTAAGAVRVIVQHPETVGHGPQLFQTFTVHRAPITKVALTTNHLIAVCGEYNHVRSWVLTRFRGMISTQPGSTPLASFKALTLAPSGPGAGPGAEEAAGLQESPEVGPFGDQDGEQLFVQKVVPDTDQLFVRLASNGERVCVVKSVDGSSVSSYLVHECEGSSRMGSSRPRRYLFTGHSNGSIQIWDLTTALDQYGTRRAQGGGQDAAGQPLGGPSPQELLALIDDCEITTSTPALLSPAHSLSHSLSHLPP